jgi:hypothetical protein
MKSKQPKTERLLGSQHTLVPGMNYSTTKFKSNKHKKIQKCKNVNCLAVVRLIVGGWLSLGID